MLFQVSESQNSPLPTTATRRDEIEWPVLHNGDASYPAEFENGSWKCPFCCHATPKIRPHLKNKHEDLIKDWGCAEKFCTDMAAAKRKEQRQKADKKRAEDPKRKEVLKKALKKADKKRAEDPKRKEVLKKADKKREPERAKNPKRKEVLKKVDKKRADDPKRKEVLKKAGKKYAQTKDGKEAHCHTAVKLSLCYVLSSCLYFFLVLSP